MRERDMRGENRKFNGFDVALVVIALLVAGGLWLLLSNRDEAVEDSRIGDEVVYLVEVNNLFAWQAEQVQIGDRLQEAVRHVPIGEVIDIDVRPFETRVYEDATQEITFQSVPDRYTLILTVRAEAEVTEQEVLAEGEHPIRGGMTLHFSGPGYAFSSGIILTLLRGE